MEYIEQDKLEYLLNPSKYNSFCIVSDPQRNKRELRFSYTSLLNCANGLGSPNVRGFKNGHYGGILLMPENEENTVYFLVKEGSIEIAQEDENSILRLINSNCLFPERRPSKIVLEDKIVRRNN